MRRRIIRVDGAIVDLGRKQPMEAIRRALGADTLDVVRLRHLGLPAQVMLVDDTGMVDGKPVNRLASKLYWANCKQGTTHPICGDVAVVPDEDFA